MKRLLSFFRIAPWLFGIAVWLSFVLRWLTADDLRLARAFGYILPWLPPILFPLGIAAQRAKYRWLSAILLLPLFIIGVIYAPLFFNCKQVNAADPQSIKVMSYNVWVFNPNMASVGKLILREKPDILFLQEIRPEHFLHLLEELKSLYANKKPIVDHVPEMNLAIISRFPIK